MNALTHTLNVLSASTASTIRSWRGLSASRHTRQPEKMLVLYDMEASPYCRIVREALTTLDIDVLIYPCPKGGQRFRPQAEALGGQQQFPLLVDPNNNQHLYESKDIVDYLYQTYSDQPAPQYNQLQQQLNIASSYAATVLRLDLNGIPGMQASPSTAPEQPLELYSFESSPYSKAVRERLCELEIPFITRQFGKATTGDMGPPIIRTTFFKNEPVKGRNREKMFALTGRLQVPYLIDPNTDKALYESRDIIAYLNQQYAL